MNVNPKRQFPVVLVLFVLVALAIFFLPSRQDPKKDVPHLVFLRIDRTNGQNVAVFRLDAPKSQKVHFLRTLTSPAIVSGTNRIPTFINPNYGYIEAGASQEFRVVASNDDAWRLEMDLFTPHWRRDDLHVFLQTIQSEPITNAMPKSADTSR